MVAINTFTLSQQLFPTKELAAAASKSPPDALQRSSKYWYDTAQFHLREGFNLVARLPNITPFELQQAFFHLYTFMYVQSDILSQYPDFRMSKSLKTSLMEVDKFLVQYVAQINTNYDDWIKYASTDDLPHPLRRQPTVLDATENQQLVVSAAVALNEQRNLRLHQLYRQQVQNVSQQNVSQQNVHRQNASPQSNNRQQPQTYVPYQPSSTPQFPSSPSQRQTPEPPLQYESYPRKPRSDEFLSMPTPPSGFPGYDDDDDEVDQMELMREARRELDRTSSNLEPDPMPPPIRAPPPPPVAPYTRPPSHDHSPHDRSNGHSPSPASPAHESNHSLPSQTYSYPPVLPPHAVNANSPFKTDLLNLRVSPHPLPELPPRHTIPRKDVANHSSHTPGHHLQQQQFPKIPASIGPPVLPPRSHLPFHGNGKATPISRLAALPPAATLPGKNGPPRPRSAQHYRSSSTVSPYSSVAHASGSGKAKQTEYVFGPSAYLESGEPLRTIFLPSKLKHDFVKLAAKNTKAKIETCGMLCGMPHNNALYIQELVVPEQIGTSDTCETTNELAIYEHLDHAKLNCYGWIHTHPTQTCFMSSRDLHTHASYQSGLPEAIAIVCAPTATPSFGIYRLTDPPGQQHILNCHKKETFHTHSESKLYTQCLAPTGHVIEHGDIPYSVIDLRPKR